MMFVMDKILMGKRRSLAPASVVQEGPSMASESPRGTPPPLFVFGSWERIDHFSPGSAEEQSKRFRHLRIPVGRSRLGVGVGDTARSPMDARRYYRCTWSRRVTPRHVIANSPRRFGASHVYFWRLSRFIPA